MLNISLDGWVYILVYIIIWSLFGEKCMSVSDEVILFGISTGYLLLLAASLLKKGFFLK